MKNTPYLKSYSKNGLVSNPITKEQPYLNVFKTAKNLRDELKESKNNSKSFRIVITNLGKGLFMKVKFKRVIFENFVYQLRSNKVKRKYKTVLNQIVSYSK
ncbi:MAG: hypothetical protein ACJA2M_000281 [Polaribacter sp.]|jgi:hypothetical protein